MKELNIYPLTGLFTALQMTGFQDISAESPLVLKGDRSLDSANSLFWANHLAPNELASLIDLVQDRYGYAPCYIPQFQAVLENPDLFLSRIKKSVHKLSQPIICEQDFFCAMETLTILCNLYSDFVYPPFRLTIDQGFLLNETDTRDLVKNCLSPATNPYYNFINKYCRPVMEAIQPDVIWIYGQPTFSSFAMALMARKTLPHIHICLIDLPSEYYALNKIIPQLKTNDSLFSIIDSILLYEEDAGQQGQVLAALKKGDSLSRLPNLIYKDKSKGRIINTPTQLPAKDSVSLNLPYFESLSPNTRLKKEKYTSEVMALKLWQKTACYWNKCSFCGINEKYPSGSMSGRYENIDEKVNFIVGLKKAGYEYFWMTDEAIPPAVLKRFADKLIDKKIKVYWQTRSRIDKGFSQEVCESLAKAGLKEIRFGLESASYRILKLMNKFPEDFNLALVETIVKRFHERGVSVHLCLILDFPGETHRDRMATFDFLRRLKHKYPSLTFNLNRFMLDIKSKIFTQYETFDITKIEWPCPSRYFLGNQVEWESENRHYHKNQIDDLRNTFMRQNMYPWMPENPMTPPFNFYMQYETFKMTLVWKTKMGSTQKKDPMPLSKETRIIKSSHIVYIRLNKENIPNRYEQKHYRVYNWKTHIHFECNEKLIELYNIFTLPRTIAKGLSACHARGDFSAMSKEQLFKTYFPELEKALSLKILVPARDGE
jgi:hypothetical protein